MKKLFISCPMKDRTEENIRNSMECMHKMAEAYFGQELDVIPSYIPDRAPDSVNRRIWYLGESIKLMAENEVARLYDIPKFFVDSGMMPDVCEIERAYYRDLCDEK